MKYIKIHEGIIYEIQEKEAQEQIIKYNNYYIKNEEIMIIDMDKKSIKPYVRFLLNRMGVDYEIRKIILTMIFTIVGLFLTIIGFGMNYYKSGKIIENITNNQKTIEQKIEEIKDIKTNINVGSDRGELIIEKNNNLTGNNLK